MNKMRSSVKKVVGVTLSLIMLISILAACTGNEVTTDDQKRVLRIATVYGDVNNTDYLRMQYTDIYQYAHRNIEIEFVTAIDYGRDRYGQTDPEEEQPDPIEEMLKLMEGPNPPDVVFLGLPELAGIVEANMLKPLDALMQQDELDVSDYVPSVIDGLKELGNGQLYALAPTFTSQALMYNMDIFTEKGIPAPQDNMEWEQIFNLAQQVTSGEGEDRIAGFAFSPSYYNDLFYEMRTYAAPLNLQLFDENSEKMLVDSQDWEDAWQAMVDLNESGVLPVQPEFNNTPMDGTVRNPFQHDAFLSGKLAMTIADYYRVNEIINANNDADLIEGYDHINWDVVTVPVHPIAPDVGGFVSMDPIMGINAKAQNSEDAWDFVKFMNGEEWAELKSQSTNTMVSRESYIKPREGVNFNIEAFYKLKPAPMANDSRYRGSGRINEAMWMIESIGQEKFRQVLEGNLGVRDALLEWQTEGELMMQQVKDNPDTPIWELRNTIRMQGMSSDEMILRQKLMEAAGEVPAVEEIIEDQADADSDDSTDVEAEVETDEATDTSSDSSSSSSDEAVE